MSKDDDNILAEGPFGTVEYAVRADGSMPAKKGLAKLKTKDHDKFSWFKALFKQYVLKGKLPKSKFDGYNNTKLNKFKHKQCYPYRIPVFSIEDRHFLTHVYKKREGDAFINTQIRKANKIMNEHKAKYGKKRG